jgi:hypothetical protein
MLYKTLIRPILTYGCECRPLKKNGNTLRMFERRILRMIYVPIKDNGTWICDISAKKKNSDQRV